MVNVAFIEDKLCVNVAVFETLAEAKELFQNVIECPEGYGIGDSYDGKKWTKAPPPPEPPEPEDTLTVEEVLNILLGGVEIG